MSTVPLDLGSPSRRRIGPFWIEEGLGLVAAGALILAAAVGMYAVAAATNPF